MSKDILDVLKEEFQSKCKVISLKYEYEGYDGMEQWAIVSSLSEEEILLKYGDFVQAYIPFLVLPLSYGEIRREFKRNENKHYMRLLRGHIFTLDEEFDEHHPEVATEDCMVQVLANERNQNLWNAINTLDEKQKRRLLSYYFNGKTYREIADEEGVDHKAIVRSVEAAVRKLKKILI